MGWSGRALPRQRFKLARGAKDKEHAMSEKLNTAIAVIGIDIGKNSFHVVGHDERGAIVLRQKWLRGQVSGLPHKAAHGTDQLLLRSFRLGSVRTTINS